MRAHALPGGRLEKLLDGSACLFFAGFGLSLRAAATCKTNSMPCTGSLYNSVLVSVLYAAPLARALSYVLVMSFHRLPAGSWTDAGVDMKFRRTLLLCEGIFTYSADVA